MATITPPPAYTRAQDILENMRQKREQLVSSNPSLKRSLHKKPPTAPRMKKSLSSSSSTGSSRAQEILGDLKQKRASLTAVLEACKSPGSQKKRRDRSIGLSTAPTAASTRSLLSSIADDDSFCYSETSREGTLPKESSIEFIIDTEDSDLCSLTTREEVEQAVGAIYEEVIPKALYAIQKKRSTNNVTIETLNKTVTTTSWTFRSQSSARDLYHEESVRLNKSEKKKRRIHLSDKRSKQSSRSNASVASSSVASIDVKQLQKQRSNLQHMMESISELKGASDFSIAPTKKNSRSIRHDSSEGSAPLATRSPGRSPERISVESSCKSSSSTKLEFDLPSSLKDKPRKKKNLNSSIASHYVLETKVKHGRKKKIIVKPTELYVAPPPDPANMLPALDSDGSSEGSLLVSPASSCGEESLLVTPVQSEDEKSVQRTKDLRHSPTSDLLSKYLDVAEETKEEELQISREERKIRAKPTASGRVIYNVRSEESARIVVQETKEIQVSRDEQFLVRRRSSELAIADTDNVEVPQNVWQHTCMEPTPEEPKSEYVPKEHDDEDLMKVYLKKFTKEDIVKEMNMLADKMARKGLQIPIGTELILRRVGVYEEDDQSSTGWSLSEPSDQSTTGWSFSEPSDLSSCSCTLPSRRASRGPDTAANVSSLDIYSRSDEISSLDINSRSDEISSLDIYSRSDEISSLDINSRSDEISSLDINSRSDEISSPKRNMRPDEIDITEKFCGGLYHLAVMSGMSICGEQEV